MNISRERKGKLHLTEEFMMGGECPHMLAELQATPLAVEFDYCHQYFQMYIISPLLSVVHPGTVIQLYEVEFDSDNQTYKFKD